MVGNKSKNKQRTRGSLHLPSSSSSTDSCECKPFPLSLSKSNARVVLTRSYPYLKKPNRGSRTSFTPQDITNLATYLLSIPSRDRTKPSIFTQGVLRGKLPNHTDQSWSSHYKHNRESIDKRIEKLRREKDREYNNEQEKKKGISKGKGKATRDQEEQEEEEQEEEDGGSESGEQTSSSSSSEDTRKKKKKKRLSNFNLVASTGGGGGRKKKVKFDDQDWERLIKMCAVAKKKSWKSGDKYIELERKVSF